MLNRWNFLKTGFYEGIKDDIGGEFAFPLFEIGGLAAVVYVVGLAFTVLPALRAAALTPAQALRPKE